MGFTGAVESKGDRGSTGLDTLGVDAGKAGWTAFAAILFVLVAAILIVKTCVALALFPQPIYCVTPPFGSGVSHGLR